jgi:hypothetical protein
MSDAEVMTTSIVAAAFFGGNMERARTFLKEQGYIPNMLEKSRFNRRQHRIADLFLTVFHLLAEHWKDLNEQSIYVVDSFPMVVCETIGFRVHGDIVEKLGVAIKPARNASFIA